MKRLITILIFGTLFISLSAQTDFEKDTAQANKYYNEAYISDDINESIKLVEQAIQLYEAHPFCLDYLEAKSYLSSLFCLNDEVKSGQIAQEAIALAEENNIPKDDEAIKWAYFSFINSYCTGNPSKSLEYGEILLKQLPKPSMNHFDVLNSLGKSTMMLNDVSTLNSLLAEMERMLSQTTDSTLLGYSVAFYILKASESRMINNSQESIIYSKKAIDINKIYSFFEDNLIKSEYSNISSAYSYLRNIQEAQKWLEKYINEVDTTGFDDINLYYHYSKVNSLYKSMGKYDKSLEYVERGIDVILPYKDTHKSLLQEAYSNKADVFFQIKEYEKAEKYINKSLEYGLNDVAIFFKINILKERGKFKGAIELVQSELKRNIPDFLPKNIQENPLKYQIVSNYSISVQRLLGTKALVLYHSSKKDTVNRLPLLRASIAANELFLFAKNHYLYFTKMSSTGKFCYTCSYEIGLTIVQNEIYEITQKEEDLDKAFEYVEKYKAKFLLETLQKGNLPEELLREKKEINEQVDFYEFKMKLAGKDSIDFFERKYLEASEILGDFSKRVAKKYPKNAIFLNNLKPAKIEDIQKVLPKDHIVISYAYTSANILAFSITSDKKRLTEISIEANPVGQINELIQLLKNPLIVQKSKKERFIDISHSLYKILIEPLEEEIRGKKTLSFIMSGELFHLPIELLLASDEKKNFEELDFLIKNHEVNYHYSATAYILLKDRLSIKNYSLLAFAPVFGEKEIVSNGLRSLNLTSEEYNSIENDKFISLPNSKKEVKAIAKILEKKGKTMVLLERNATKKKLLQAIKKKPYQFLHIATHSIVNINNPKLSALACYTDNENANDDLLFATEIQMEEIQADLVVLSSCESGIGRLIEGEGLIALNRSFIYSGARNVLFSLWKVNDQYSSDLMINFYKNYMKTPSYTTALRQAKLQLLQNPTTANPRFWAPFVLMGE
jgi:CHAT domain-containing protein